METQALHRLIRQKLADGRLSHGITRLWGGTGDDELCHACEEVIAKPDLIIGGVAVGDLAPLQLHVQCLYVWDVERRNAGDSVSRPTTVAPELPLARSSLTGVRVLLVDDDEVALYAWRRYLVTAEAHVTSATDGEGALVVLRQDTVDVLVADLKLPGVVDGLQLAEAARALGRPVVAIAVTGYPEERPRALRAGFAACLAKPLEPLDLVREITRCATRA